MTTTFDADAAVLALLETAGVKLYDGYVTDSDESEKTISAPLPYCVFYSTPGYPVNPRSGGAPDRAQEFQVTSVGMTREQAVWAGDKAEGVLHGATVQVGGRRRSISRTSGNVPTARDDTWTRPDGGSLFSDVRRYQFVR